GWSSIALADALQKRTGYRLIVELDKVCADLEHGRVTYEGVDLCALDALLIKKAGRSYSPDMLDRLELLRFVEERGVPVFSRPSRIIRLLDRLSCTVTLASAGIPMPATVVTESVTEAAAAIRRFGSAVLKP